MQYKWGITSVVVIAIVLIAWVLFAPAMQPIKQSIVFHYTDGTSSELTPFPSITYEGKDVSSIEYKVSGEDIELSDYTPYFHSAFRDQHLEPKNGCNASWVVDIYEILYYSLDDGIYKVTLVPSGEIPGVALPSPIEFELELLDDRSINLVFG